MAQAPTEIKGEAILAHPAGKLALKAVSCGTELTITQEGIPDVIRVEVCHLG